MCTIFILDIPLCYTGYTQKNGAVLIVLKPHHSFVYALYITRQFDDYHQNKILLLCSDMPI